MELRPTIHIAIDIGYLFPAEAGSARTACGRLVREILAKGEFIGLGHDLNPECKVCEECSKEYRGREGN